MRRFLVVITFIAAASGIAFASFPTTDIIQDLINANKLDELIGGQYWLRSDPYGSSQKYKSHYVKDPEGNDMYGKPVPAGASVDLAWTLETGDPRVVIAIIDTGTQWLKPGLINKYYLNRSELMKHAPYYANDAPVFDYNRDGVFNVKDYADALKEKYPGGDNDIVLGRLESSYNDWVSENFNHWKNNYIRDYELKNGEGSFKEEVPPAPLTPQHLIMAFSDGVDDDLNGFVDDICGWDFFENDNDADDTSSYTDTAMYHGTGQNFSAGGEFFDDAGLIEELGSCPNCMIMPLKASDSFVHDTNYYGLAAMYAAISGAHIIEGALGGLNNSGICKDALEFAYKRGLVVMMASSDINSANHNWPTYLNEPMYCSGVVPDNFIEGADPKNVGTWFRNSGLCQFGSKAQVCNEVSTGSHSTALTSGYAGLLISRALHLIENEKKMNRNFAYPNGMPLHPDQIKQILTLSAEDVVPEDTQGLGTPDPSKVGWDQHFGYGRINMYWALKMLNDVKLPAVARITSPLWNYYITSSETGLVLRGDVLFTGTDARSWVIEGAWGIEPEENELKKNVLKSGSQQGEDIDFGGPVDIERIKSMRPIGLDLGWYSKEPDTAYRGDAKIQANRHMFTVRLKVLDSKGRRIAEDRRTFFFCEDKNLHEGWPKFLGVGGEASPRFEDLDGDNRKEVIIATSDGRILVYTHDGRPFKYLGETVEFAADELKFDGLNLKTTQDRMRTVLGRSASLRPSFVTPAVADIDGDGIKEIVGAAGDKVYCFYLDINKEPLRMDISANIRNDLAQGKIHNADHDKNNFDNSNSIQNSIGRGILAPPVLFDINNDGFKEIIAAGQDQRIYAWDKDGRMCRGWPVYSRKYEKMGQKIIYSPCIADLDGDRKYEVVVATNESISADGKTPVEISEENRQLKLKLGKKFLAAKEESGSQSKLPGGLVASVLDTVTGLAGKDCLIYAIKGEGNGYVSDGGMDYAFSQRSFVKGWPVALKALLPDILPHLGPSTKPAAFDFDNDGADEIVASATSAQTAVIDGDGTLLKKMKQSPMGGRAKGYLSDTSMSLNLYDSVALGNLDSDDSIEIAQGGLTLFGALNLFISGQNFPFDHVMQVWDSRTGSFEDAFPRPVDDFILYSEPAIADVDGDGVNEVIGGNGLYLVHAIGTDGLDRGIFPKLSAGWIMATPAVADIDGDGKNEVAVITREGGVFIWDTDGEYTADSRGKPQTWPTFGHDNCNTSNLGYDAIAPGTVLSYTWEDGDFVFNCPGDDGFNGKAARVSIYGYSEPINQGNFAKASLIKEITPATGGRTLYITIPDEHECYAVVATDEAGNSSQLSLTGGIGHNGKPVFGENSPGGSDDGGGSGMCFMSSALNM